MDTQHVVDTMFPVVCQRLGCNKPAEITIVPFENFDKTLAFCKYMSDGVYQICYHTEAKDIITTICHELVHIVQHLRGDKFRIDLPYEQQPHEIEAYALEKELADYYRGHL